MFRKIRNLGNSIKALRLFGVLFAALAVAVASPSAASADNGIGIPPVDEYGVLRVSILYPSSTASDAPATLTVYDGNGVPVLKTVAYGGTTDVAKLLIGKYSVTVSQTDYVSQKAGVEISANDTAHVMFGMKPLNNSVRNPRLSQ